MSQHERDILTIMRPVLQGERTQVEAVRLLGLSVRQVRRLLRKLQERGAAALIHGLRGQPSKAPEPVAVETLSAEQIFTDLHEELVGRHRVLRVAELLGCLSPPVPAEQVRARLWALLGRAWSASWRKAANKKRRPPKPKRKELGAHTSVHKILEAAKAASDKTQKPSVSSG